MAGQGEARLHELQRLLPEVDPNLQRFFPFTVEKVSATGDAADLPGTYFVRGLASVYNQWSLDLGGFRERVLPGAFDDVLRGDPHVLHVWDHDTSKTLSSTRNGTLELSSVDAGLQYYSKVAPTSYAQDLRILLERGDIDQSSFAFTVEEDEWRFLETEEEEIVERSIIKVGGLYDVTTCAMGAFPQTDAQIAVRSLLKASRATAGVQWFTQTATGGPAAAAVVYGFGGPAPPARTVAPAEPVGEPEPVEPQAGGESPSQEEHRQGGDTTGLADLKRRVSDAQRATRRRVFNVKED